MKTIIKIEFISLIIFTFCLIKIFPITEPTEVEISKSMDDIYFVGDSTTYHFKKVGIDESRILVPPSHTLRLSSDILSVSVGETGLSIADALGAANAEMVIITLGVNGADSFSEISYKTYYNKLIEDILEKSPNTSIIIQSVFPVLKDYSDQNLGITNFGIDRINSWAKEMAAEKGIYYLDTQSILKDGSGALIQEYNEGDGVHLNAQGYRAIIDYIKIHLLYGGENE